ncbi:coproporphyrinogen dehydrogenase HemZ [Desulfitobacterium metallireducens]|uniref:coproporphyrinogen dehydrogenase HemZ n=1 Tax=Desulfitobacterium metallireducens TaxID=142877 RepID=UPI000311D86D|nr:coproporphyrinogen dehydrogenase HemZ [Desulfitobacterium metallireducens]
MNKQINLELSSMTLSRSEMEAGLSLIRAFFPKGKVWVKDPEMINMEHDAENRIAVIEVEVNFPAQPYCVQSIFYDEMSNDLVQSQSVRVTLDSQDIMQILDHPQVGKETERKILLKHGLFHLLTQVTGHTPPWGILTGIRPSKILHRLNDLGIAKTEEKKVLEEHYLIREDKTQLLREIVALQRPYLHQLTEHPEHVAVYVGIPFCPTRCSYCSFPAYSLQHGREPLQFYLKGLYEEIRATGEWMKETRRWASSLYLGGGTPTILSTSEISDLLQWIRDNIPMTEEIELSVEAGRPDTLSQEKLQALNEQGVNRLSINPQTMHDETLKRIGRAHSVEDILRIYELAREVPGWVINMDLILGLPGETTQEVQETLNQIGKLRPDNLTVHALAIKRGSKEYEAGLVQSLGKDLESMQELALVMTRSFGMRPYYLYRQKHIAGNLENIGFALPGAECYYNIGIMEERQSVLGIGAGASSKVVNSKDYTLVNLQHPSNWQVYLKRWPELHQKRVNAFLTL